MLNAEKVIKMLDNNKAYYWYLSDYSGANIGYYPTDANAEKLDAKESMQALRDMIEPYEDSDLFSIKASAKKGSSDNRQLSYTFVKLSQMPQAMQGLDTPASNNKDYIDERLAAKSEQLKLEFERMRLEQERRELQKYHQELKGIEQTMSSEFGFIFNGFKGIAKDVLLGVGTALVKQYVKHSAPLQPQDEAPKDARYLLVEKVAEKLYLSEIDMEGLRNILKNLDYGIFGQNSTEAGHYTEEPGE